MHGPAINYGNRYLAWLWGIHKQDKNGNTPLHKAETTEDALKFIKAGANVNAKNNNGDTPLLYVLEKANNDLEIVHAIAEILINNGAIVDAVNEENMTFLHYICSRDTAETLSDSIIDDERGDIDIYKRLIDLAVTNKTINATDNKDNTPLHLAMGNCFSGEMTQLLLDKGAGGSVSAKNNVGNTPLHEAMGAYVPSATAIKVLIQNHADVNAKNNNDDTPLHHAALRAHLLPRVEEAGEVTKVLIKNRADVNAKNNNGNTPLHEAALCAMDAADSLSREEVAEFIQKTPDERVLKVLEAAEDEVIKVLIKNRADVNEKNNNGNTPLHHAALKRDLSLMIFLLKNGANFDKENKNRDSPNSIIVNTGDQVFIRTLQTLVNIVLHGQATEPPGGPWASFSPDPLHKSMVVAGGTRKRGTRKRGTRKRGARKRGARKRGTRKRGTRKRDTRKRGTRKRDTRKRGTRSSRK